MMKLLLLEDRVEVARSLGEFLEAKGCEVDYAYTGKSCVELVKQDDYDVLVLDIAMPGFDGLDACREIRFSLNVATPIIFLTARDTLDDKLTGFRQGADDYLVKPFSPDELLCRLQALAARGPRRDFGLQKIGDLEINHALKRVIRADVYLTISPVQFKILAALAKRSPQLVSKEALESTVWDGNPPASDAFRTHMYRLRNIVDKPFATAMIKSVHGKGYRIEPG